MPRVHHIHVAQMPSLAHLFHERVRRTPNTIAWSVPTQHKKDPAWRHITWAKHHYNVSQMASGLEELDPDSRSPVAVWGYTTYPWIVTDSAAICSGREAVQILAGTKTPQAVDVLRASKASVLYLDAPVNYATIAPHLDELPDLKAVVSREKQDATTQPKFYPLARLQSEIASGRSGRMDEALARLTRDDEALLFQTSGTTARTAQAILKPVPNTHGNVLAGIEGVMGSYADLFATPQTMFSILHYTHVFGRAEWGIHMAIGSHAYLAEGAFEFLKYWVPTARPTMIFGVPDMLDKIRRNALRELQNKIKDARGNESMFAGVYKGLALLGERGLKALNEPDQAKGLLETRLFPWLMGRLVRGKLGGRLRTVVSGGAHMPEEHVKFFQRAGVKTYEGYGLTENAGPCAASFADADEAGILYFFPSVEWCLNADGVIQIRGPMVFNGYGLNSKQRDGRFEQPVDADGWFTTGDCGEIVMGKRGKGVRITGRADNMFKIGGEKVHPEPIEDLFKTANVIQRVVLFPDQQGKRVMALIAVDPTFIAPKLKDSSILDREGWETNAAVLAIIQAVIDGVNANPAVHDFERIQRFRVLVKPFEKDRDELTPTDKPKRNIIRQTRADDLAAMEI